MPAETMIVVLAVIVPFAIFAAALAWAQGRTRQAD